MILLVGVDHDPVMKYFAKFLHNRNVEIFFINQNTLNSKIVFHKNHFTFERKDYYYNLFSGTFCRLNSSNFQNSNENKSYQFLLDLVNNRFKNVLTRPYLCQSNASKPYQLRISNLSGCYIPNSKILSNKLPSNTIKEQSIYKSTSSIRSIVKIFDSKNFTFCYSPTLFQSFIEGSNFRVHVISGKCFALKIDSNSADYRYDPDTKYSEVNLSDSVAKSCCQLAQKLDLDFCGIDLIFNDGKYYVLEVNPTPGYSFFESKFSRPLISEKLLEYLTQDTGDIIDA